MRVLGRWLRTHGQSGGRGDHGDDGSRQVALPVGTVEGWPFTAQLGDAKCRLGWSAPRQTKCRVNETGHQHNCRTTVVSDQRCCVRGVLPQSHRERSPGLAHGPLPRRRMGGVRHPLRRALRRCRHQRQTTLYLEAKGTQSNGDAVFLTRGEVEHARLHRGNCVIGIWSGMRFRRRDRRPGGRRGAHHAVRPGHGHSDCALQYRWDLGDNSDVV